MPDEVTVQTMWNSAMGIAAALVLVASAITIIVKAIEPLNRIKKLEECQAASDARYKHIAKALSALLEHAETGNASGKMSTARVELQEFFIDN